MSFLKHIMNFLAKRLFSTSGGILLLLCIFLAKHSTLNGHPVTLKEFLFLSVCFYIILSVPLNLFIYFSKHNKNPEHSAIQKQINLARKSNIKNLCSHVPQEENCCNNSISDSTDIDLNFDVNDIYHNLAYIIPVDDLVKDEKEPVDKLTIQKEVTPLPDTDKKEEVITLPNTNIEFTISKENPDTLNQEIAFVTPLARTKSDSNTLKENFNDKKDLTDSKKVMKKNDIYQYAVMCNAYLEHQDEMAQYEQSQ